MPKTKSKTTKRVTPVEKRKEILDKIKQLGKFQKGTISKQYFTKPDGTRLGPYYLLQGYKSNGDHYSQRIPEDMVPQIQKEIDEFKKFHNLTNELQKSSKD